jgi:hypothetical protein
VETRIDERDAPVIEIARVQLRLLLAGDQREVVGQRLVVVEEIFAHQIAAVAETQNEFRMAVMRVVAHQVPEDGAWTDADERLRNRVRMLAQARAQPSAKQHHLHFSLPALRPAIIIRTSRQFPRKASRRARRKLCQKGTLPAVR